MADENPDNVQPPGPEAEDGPEAVPTDLQQAEAAMDSVEQAAEAVEDAATTEVGLEGAVEQALDLPDFVGAGPQNGDHPSAMGLLGDVDVRVKVELGRTRMYVEDVLRLNADSVIELDKAAGDPVDIFVNNRHVARGEVLVLNENFCVRISEIISAGNPEDGPEPQ